MTTPRSVVLALYRESLRESRKLLDPVARYTFLNHIRNRFRRNARIRDEELRYKKIKVARTRLRHLQAANARKVDSVAWVLRRAYGNSGPLYQSNMRALIDSGGPHDQSKQARPPAFHPALRAVVTNPQTRIKQGSRPRPDGPSELPGILEQRDWLGKIPERREKNLWWKWWRLEPTKLQMPVEINVVEEANKSTGQSVSESTLGLPDAVAAIKRYGLPELKTQGLGYNQRLEQLVRNRRQPKLPRRSPERLQQASDPDSRPGISLDPSVPPQNRFYRRRYSEALARLPLLSFKPSYTSHFPDAAPNSTPETQKAGLTPETQQAEEPNTRQVTKPNVFPGKYTAWISPFAASRGNPRNRVTYSVMSEEDRQWVERSQQSPKQTRPKQAAHQDKISR